MGDEESLKIKKFNGQNFGVWKMQIEDHLYQKDLEDYNMYQKPWIMMTTTKPGQKTRDFYSPLEGKSYQVKLPKVVRRSYCCGSYQGWLIMAHKTKGNFIYNPITRKQVTLPTLQLENLDLAADPPRPLSHTQYIKRRPYFLSKVVLSNLPPPLSSSSSPFFAAAITENYKILIVSLNKNKWHHFCPLTLKEEDSHSLSIRLPTIYITSVFYFGRIPEIPLEDPEEIVELKPDQEIEERQITDIIFYKGEFYMVNFYGNLFLLKVINEDEFSLRKVTVSALKLKRKDLPFYSVCYLVESCNGELLMVLRIRDQEHVMERFGDRRIRQVNEFMTTKFLVFRLEQASDDGPSRWAKVEGLGDQVLLLGQNYSHSVSSHQLNHMRNCIIFTNHVYGLYRPDGRRMPYKDLGVYHLDTGQMDNLLPSEFTTHLYMCRKFQPIMFTPNPW